MAAVEVTANLRLMALIGQKESMRRKRALKVRLSRPAYQTSYGKMLRCQVESFFASNAARYYKGRVSLIFTSPPFPLNRKKAYGNLNGEQYVRWLAAFAPKFKELLTPAGSIVLELGNAWQPGRPIMSTLALEALLAFAKEGNFELAQQFICHNPARLPSPAQWVNVERIRVKDSYTHVWWMSGSDCPYADNRNVLQPYSASMLKLLKAKTYNSGKRPSQHKIGEKSFLRNNHGSIPSNVLTFSNTSSNNSYHEYCREKGLKLQSSTNADRTARILC